MALEVAIRNTLPCLLICAVALFAVGLHFTDGYPTGHSYNYNVAWATAFLGQLLSGDHYPRWLVDYPAGLGAPVFYYYAPAPFYLVGLGVPFCQDCGVEQLLSFGHGAIFALSGIAFYFWISGLTARGVGLFAAGCYMLLPYHFVDVEVRNSIGESMAYIWMPLILLGLRFLQTSLYAIVLSALAYAGLILSHLPSALLFTPIMVIFTYALAGRAALGASTVRLMATGILGVALGAIYMVPALMLRDHVPHDAWVSASGPRYSPENSLLFSDADLSSFSQTVHRALITSTLLGVPAVGGALFIRLLLGSHEPSFSSDQKRVLTAASIALALCWFMMTAPSQWLWTNLNILRQVQFPWRVGPIIDLCAATLFAIAVWCVFKTIRTLPSPQHRLWAKALCTVIILGMTGSTLSVTWNLSRVPRNSSQGLSLAEEIARLPSIEIDTRGNFRRGSYPVEYRPKWVVESTIYRSNISDGGTEQPHRYHQRGYQRWASHVATLPEIRVEGTSDRDGQASIKRVGATSFEIEATLSEPATIHLRRTYFPSWLLRDLETSTEVSVRPSAVDGLVEFDLSAGTHRLLLTMRLLMWETLGILISAFALLLAICLICYERWILGKVSGSVKEGR